MTQLYYNIEIYNFVKKLNYFSHKANLSTLFQMKAYKLYTTDKIMKRLPYVRTVLWK